MSSIEKEIHDKYAKKWAVPKVISDKDAKVLAKDVYENKIFTDHHIDKNSRGFLTMTVFMPLMFIHAPTELNTNDPVQKKRDMDIYLLLDKDIEDHYRTIWLNNIAMVYEYYDKAMPRGINGYPTFGSMRILTIESYEKFAKFYQDYVEFAKKWEETDEVPES